jgi:hypothetical protein
MVFRHDQDVQESDFHLVHYLSTRLVYFHGCSIVSGSSPRKL